MENAQESTGYKVAATDGNGVGRSRRKHKGRTSAGEKRKKERLIRRGLWIGALIVIVLLLTALKFKTYILTH